MFPTTVTLGLSLTETLGLASASSSCQFQVLIIRLLVKLQVVVTLSLTLLTFFQYSIQVPPIFAVTVGYNAIGASSSTSRTASNNVSTQTESQETLNPAQSIRSRRPRTAASDSHSGRDSTTLDLPGPRTAS